MRRSGGFTDLPRVPELLRGGARADFRASGSRPTSGPTGVRDSRKPSVDHLQRNAETPRWLAVCPPSSVFLPLVLSSPVPPNLPLTLETNGTVAGDLFLPGESTEHFLRAKYHVSH